MPFVPSCVTEARRDREGQRQGRMAATTRIVAANFLEEISDAKRGPFAMYRLAVVRSIPNRKRPRGTV